MFSFDLTYFLANAILLFTMWYCGYKISKGRSYWRYALAVIFVFTLVEGLRYGRGVDYMHYIYVYKYDLEKTQVLFTALNSFLKYLGLLPEYCFIVYAFFFIVGAMVLLKPLRTYSVYIFPCFLLSIISYHEAFIRQFFAMSFVFVYVYMLNRITVDRMRKIVWVVPVLMALAAYSIHSVSVVTIIGITLLFFLFKKPFSWRLTIPALIIGKFVIASNFDWGSLNTFFDFVASSSDSKLSGYAGNSDRWFSNDAMNLKFTRSPIIQMLEVFGCASAFYLGNKMCRIIQIQSLVAEKKDHICIVLFNTFVLGCLILETFYNIELVRRLAFGWYIYWFVPVALVLYYRKVYFKEMVDRFLILGFSFWLWEYIRFLFVFGKRPLFLWDM